MRKESSTNTLNSDILKEMCGTMYALSLLGGRWKPIIIWRLLKGKMRYSELRKSIPNVSERMLILQLRELENDFLIQRIAYPEVPPRVEYDLTELGHSMRSMLEGISDWGETHKKEVKEGN